MTSRLPPFYILTKIPNEKYTLIDYNVSWCFIK